MSESPLIIKSKAFALEVISACKVLREAKCESALKVSFCVRGRALARILCSRQGGFRCEITYCPQGML